MRVLFLSATEYGRIRTTVYQLQQLMKSRFQYSDENTADDGDSYSDNCRVSWHNDALYRGIGAEAAHVAVHDVTSLSGLLLP